MTTLKFDGNSQYLRVNDSDVFDFGEDRPFSSLLKGTIRALGVLLFLSGGSGMGIWQFRRVNEFTAFTIRGTSDGMIVPGGHSI